MKPIGSVFLHYEDYWGSGEKGCYTALEITGEPYGTPPYLTPVRWIAHSCDQRPGKTTSMKIEHYDAKGNILWLREGP